MSEKTAKRSNGAMKKQESYWQADWMTKVLSNGYNAQAKIVFMRIASFGERGCWMKNETLQEELGRSESTIRRAVSSLWTKGDIIVTGWNGHGRKMYAAGHPKVRPELNALYDAARLAGKVDTVEQYKSKVRLRVKTSDSEN